MTGHPRSTAMRLAALSAAWGCWLAGGAVAHASTAAQLQCQVTYAGTTHTVLAEPVQDPYPVPAVDIGGRFRFKPIVVGTAQQVERVLVYAYLVEGAQALLIHQAKYLQPWTEVTQPPRSLTGQQFLYAGPLERELQYNCSWLGGRP